MSHFGLGLISSPGVPGNDAFTKILLHMDGSNGGTTFTDVNAGGSPHTWTPSSATTSASAAKFGPTSMLTASGYITTPDHADFTIGSGDFTIDFWINPNGTTGYQGLCGQSDSLGNLASVSVYMWRDASNRILALSVAAGVGGGASLASTATLTGSSWSHLALVKSGTSLKLYIDGVNDGSATYPILGVNDSSRPWTIGRAGDVAGASSCYIDEFRFSVGIARWTSNFTPPAAQYT